MCVIESMLNVNVEPRFRENDKLTVSASAELDKEMSGRGWSDFGYNGEIIFSKRDRTTVSNKLSLNYSFNQNLNFNLPG